jgi:ADP-ribose pyrophosphatase YjhB (NUDIX family)
MMAISPYVAGLRRRIGPDLLLLPSVMGIIYDAQSRVLLVRQFADSLWSTPGGVIEPDETPRAAVVREVREETGLDVSVVRLLGVYGGPEFVVEYPNGDRSQYVSVIFECAVRSGEAKPDGEETDALTFAGPTELERLRCQPWMSHVMPLLWRRDAAPFFQ